MFKFLRWGNLVLICLAAMGCAANGSFDITKFDTPRSGQGLERTEQVSSLTVPPGDRTLIEKEIPSKMRQDPAVALEPPEEFPSSSPHDLILNLPAAQDEEEERQAAPLPFG